MYECSCVIHNELTHLKLIYQCAKMLLITGNICIIVCYSLHLPGDESEPNQSVCTLTFNLLYFSNTVDWETFACTRGKVIGHVCLSSVVRCYHK